MDAYQRLTENLPARAPPGRAQHSSEKSVRDAVAGVPLANPAQAVREVEQILDDMLAVAWGGGERATALAYLRAPVASLCHGIAQQLDTESHPLPPASAARAAAAQRLEWKLACNHAIALHELCEPAGKPPMFKGKLVLATLAAGLAGAGRTLVWAYRQYQAPPVGVWRKVHAFYLYAVDLGLADQTAGDDAISVRDAYLQTLLLALGNPYRFSARELKEADAVTRCVAGQCVLQRAGHAGVGVDTRADTGPAYMAEQEMADWAVLAFDAAPAAAVFEQRIALLPGMAGVLDLPQPGGGTVATSAEFLRMLKAGWTAADRAYPRLSASHALDLAVGMHALHFVLAGGLDFATFLRQVHGEAITVGQHELASSWLAASDTVRPHTQRADVLDQSEGGYRLHLPDADGARLRIGEVVGLTPAADDPDERAWMVGVIRWLRLEHDGCVLGVELLHRTARAAGLRPLTAEGESMVPQRAVELPDRTDRNRLVLLLSYHFARTVTAAEVVLPALASDWDAAAVAGTWQYADAQALGTTCIRVTLVRDEPARAGETEGVQ